MSLNLPSSTSDDPREQRRSMPCAFASQEQAERPCKRRKLGLKPEMARPSSGGVEADDDWLFEQELSSTPLDPEIHNRRDQCQIETSNRAELIECIKRGHKPKWVPKPGLQALCEQEDALTSKWQQRRDMKEADKGFELLSAEHHQPQVTNESPARPRSALHRGDFSDSSSGSDSRASRHQQPRQRSPVSPSPRYSVSPPLLLSDTPPPSFARTRSGISEPTANDAFLARRRRAPSLGSSLSSSFVERVPTSPLVHATTHDYLDHVHQARTNIGLGLSAESNRRRTLPPHTFQSWSLSAGEVTPPNFSRPFPLTAPRHEPSTPPQTHQMRRSMSSFTYQPKSNSTTPLTRSRQPSTSSDGGSRRRASMVGSFEESILRGRMSTPPSRPLNFVAQIGVMGKGACPPNLKCPPHVSVDFPAVFYNYPSSGTRSITDDAPSPYVGTIDLEQNLKSVTLASKRKGRVSNPDHPNEALDTYGLEQDSTKSNSQPFESVSIGGAYRVPKQGQLQIIIKNPNKTAVKLFLVPYDLEGMEPGTKTFVRQRSFSSGPVIDHVLGDKPTAAQDPLRDKLILRYLIHLKFCCPSKGKHYLYEDIRVVFANRVPDGKEKLQNEIQLPEPRFSTFKPTQKPRPQMNTARSEPSTPTLSNTAFEHRSMFYTIDDFGDGFQHTKKYEDNLGDGSTIPLNLLSRRRLLHQEQAPITGPSPSSQQLPFQFPDLEMSSRPSDQSKDERALSPVHGFVPTSSPRQSPLPWRSSPGTTATTRSFSPIPEAGDGLISRQLKQLQTQPTNFSRPNAES